MIFSFEAMTFPKKITYLIRIYDLLIQEYAKVTPKKGLIIFRMLWAEAALFFHPHGGALTVRFGGRGRAGGWSDLFSRFRTLMKQTLF